MGRAVHVDGDARQGWILPASCRRRDADRRDGGFDRRAEIVRSFPFVQFGFDLDAWLMLENSIHNLGIAGHIEDIAVAKDQQGKKLGLKIIQALDFIAEKVGCYKSILDCSEANEGFYVKCGFKRAGLEMAHYYEAAKST